MAANTWNDDTPLTADANENVIINFDEGGGSANNLIIKSGATPVELMRIETGGNIGIGTDSPNNMVETSGSVQYNAGTASRSGTTVSGSSTTWTKKMVGSRFVFADGTESVITAFGSTTSLTVADSGSVSSQAYNIYYMGLNLASGWKVGIGTRSPLERLHIFGGNIELQANQDGNTGVLRFFDETNSESGQLYSSGGDLKIYSLNDVLFNPVGNVGIGTTGPNEKLEVNGNIKVGASDKYLIGSVEILSGSGAPSASSPNGSLYLRTDGTGPNLYVRENGSWVSK